MEQTSKIYKDIFLRVNKPTDTPLFTVILIDR